MTDPDGQNRRVVHGRLQWLMNELGMPVVERRTLDSLPSDLLGVALYGSRARGDAIQGSDIDLLGLVSTPHPSLNNHPISFSFYTLGQLETAIGTLFGAHLRRDGKVVYDPTGQLFDVIASMGDVDVSRLFRRAHEASKLFTCLDRDLPLYLEGLLREARYLLRSCLYASAIAAGRPCFSVREIADRAGDQRLITLLASRQEAGATRMQLQECLERLEMLIGRFPDNPHGSLEATIVNEWGKPSDLLSMAFLALGVQGGGDYAEVDKVLL